MIVEEAGPRVEPYVRVMVFDLAPKCEMEIAAQSVLRFGGDAKRCGIPSSQLSPRS